MTSPTSSRSASSSNETDTLQHDDNDHGDNNIENENKNNTSSHSSHTMTTIILRLVGTFIRLCIIDLPLLGLFTILVVAMTVHKIHDDYLFPQGKLMQFHPIRRDLTDQTYYHRICTAEDVTATTFDELYVDRDINWNTTSVTQIRDKAVEHMLTHGAVAFDQLLSKETAEAAHQFINKQNHITKSWFILKQEHRYSWGIDLDMHWSLRQLWKELGEHDVFRSSLEAIVGPDPAVIEFTAITAEYGAVSQHDHADVDSSSSPVKYARSFYPAYSLFIPLQDTTQEMGATEICPGTHVCADGASTHCPQEGLNVVASGSNNLWPQGSGFIFNQQLNHKGMQHVQVGGRPRIVLILTFAPRPQTPRRGRLETRLIPQGMSYSLLWTHWGHTFSDFVNADTRMTEPSRTLRSLGVLPTRGINMITSATGRIVNEDSGYDVGYLEEFIDEDGGFPFIPKSWQRYISEEEYKQLFPSENYNTLTYWHAFLLGTLTSIEQEMTKIYVMAVCAVLALLYLVDTVRGLYYGTLKYDSFFFRNIKRMAVTHGLVILMCWIVLHTVQESSWAKSISARKAYRLPILHPDDTEMLPPSTLPDRQDILISSQLASTYLGSYGRVLDYAHPGNKHWKEVTSTYADGYMELPNNHLRHKFCDSVLEWTLADHRFLSQDKERYWNVIDNTDYLSKFCHRSLIQQTDDLADVLFREVDSLSCETEFGLFRGTSMQMTFAQSFVNDLEDMLLNQFDESPPALPSPTFFTSSGKLFSRPTSLKPHPEWNLLDSLAGSTFNTSYRELRHSLPPAPIRNEPSLGAWIEEGDRVEVMQECMYNEWWQGTVVAANPQNSDLAVVFVDGDSQDGLDPACVRPFRPYQIGDKVQVAELDNHRGIIRDISTDYNTETNQEEPKFVVSLFENPWQGDQISDRNITVAEYGITRYLPGDGDVTLTEGMAVYARAKQNHPFAKGVLYEEQSAGRWNVWFDHGDSQNQVVRTVPAANVLCATDC